MNVSAASRAGVHDEVARLLARHDGPLTGLTSLAVGADQIFAEAVLDLGGDLVFVSPCLEVENTFDETGLADFRRLRGRATQVVQLPFGAPTEAAFLAAGLYVAEHSDIVIAVWDGQPAAGTGGTADVVAYCRSHDIPVDVAWPEGATRGS